MSYRSIRIFHLVRLASLFVAAGAAADEPKPFRDWGAEPLSRRRPGSRRPRRRNLRTPVNVVSESLGTQGYAKKHIAHLEYGDISFSLGLSPRRRVRGFRITRRKPHPQSERSSTETAATPLMPSSPRSAFPALRFSSQAKVGIGVKLGRNTCVALHRPVSHPATPPFSSSAFRVTLAGLDTSKVLRVGILSP